MSCFKFQRVRKVDYSTLPKYKELTKMEQQLFVDEILFEPINSRYGLNKEGHALIDYAKNGICKGA